MEASNYDIKGLDLSADQYTVEQNLIRNEYRALDDRGNTVLEGKQKTFKLKEEFPFVDADGDDVFTVTAQQIRDYEGQYVLTDARSGEDVVVLDHEYSLLEQIMGATWTIRDPETDAELAAITSRKFVGLFRTGLLGNLIPHHYEITDADGGHVGSISGQLSMKDRYDIEIDDASSVPRVPVVAAAMVIDAIEGH
ncbi:LURP-one-related/scramblase family protein [Natrinema sp. CGMCC1.2065]|uniref:LURP-one-related/scramblase family protein n=1 Tax=Natrinema sp. CGMCC1.2065 TaxID=3445767 RepID=UPI003F4A62AD